MSAPNGRGNEDHSARVGPSAAMLGSTAVLPLSVERTKELVASIEVPFDPSQIDWRVMNTTKNQQPMRGQVVPYADQRAYTDRLNALFTPAGWTRKYTIHTTPNFQRSKDQKIVAKVLVTCELTIFSLGSHSATGEEWADDDNAGTSAEAQAFKRACSCFGLGRYLYHFDGIWVDLDERRRPTRIPTLPGWATPAGWNEGLRPNNGGNTQAKPSDAHSPNGSLVPAIEALAERLGRGLYRGILRDLAKVWNPREIREISIQKKVLEHMRSAERGIQRLQAAVVKTDRDALNAVLRSLEITSFERVDNLGTLKRIVLELERAADSKS